MKRSRLLLSLLSLIIFVVSACKKDDDGSNVSNNTQLLTNGNQKEWRLVSMVQNGVSLNMASCDQDNSWIFKKDNTLLVDEGAQKCNANDSQQYSGTWQLTADQTELQLSASNLNMLPIDTGNIPFPIEGLPLSVKAKIEELTDQNMRLSFAYFTYTFVLTYQAK